MAWGKAFGFYVVTATRSGKVLAWAAGPRNRSASCAGPAQPTWWRQSRGAWDPKGGRIIGHPSPTATDTWPKQSVSHRSTKTWTKQCSWTGQPQNHRALEHSSRTARTRLDQDTATRRGQQCASSQRTYRQHETCYHHGASIEAG